MTGVQTCALPISPTSGDPTAKEFVDPTAAVEPPASSSSDDSILSMLDTITTIQAVHG